MVRERLLNQHDRDIVLDRVHQIAGLANQAISPLIKVDVTLTFGTGQDIQELLIYRHPWYLLASSNPDPIIFTLSSPPCQGPNTTKIYHINL
jgi:hypothetical protein